MNNEEQEMKEVFAPYLKSWFPDWSDYFSIERGKEVKYLYDKDSKKPCFVISDNKDLILHELGHFIFASDEQAMDDNFDLRPIWFEKTIKGEIWWKTIKGYGYNSEVFAHSMCNYLIKTLGIESTTTCADEKVELVLRRHPETNEPHDTVELKAEPELIFEKICCSDITTLLETLRLHIIFKCKRLKRIEPASTADILANSQRVYNGAFNPLCSVIRSLLAESVGKNVYNHVEIEFFSYTLSIRIIVRDMSLNEIPQKIIDYLFEQGFEEIILDLPPDKYGFQIVNKEG